jgi:hypothetical protein
MLKWVRLAKNAFEAITLPARIIAHDGSFKDRLSGI